MYYVDVIGESDIVCGPYQRPSLETVCKEFKRQFARIIQYLIILKCTMSARMSIQVLRRGYGHLEPSY